MGKWLQRLSGNPATRALALLHFAVFLWGFTAILGRLISFGALPLVWHRLWITALVLLLFRKTRQGLRQLSFKAWKIFGGIGLVVTAHWICFYGAIKLANASVALVALSTGPLFASAFEPLIFRSRFKMAQVLTGLISVLGLTLIFREVPAVGLGLAVGVVAALLSALFSTLNKKYLGAHSATAVTWVELTAGWLALTPCMVMEESAVWWPQGLDFLWVALLGIVCTALPFIISLQVLRHISAFTANLAVNLEPVYGLLLAALVFKEHTTLNALFYLGSGIILLTVFISPILENTQKFHRKGPSTKQNNL
ncbi:MAG: DMT family transporter [Flavobacteriales bacterium]|nr:DMT family transporter [Flavobacteriales bacterium]